MSDLPTGKTPPGREDRKHFLAEAQAAADYIAQNVKGHLVRVIKVRFGVKVLPARERPVPTEPLQREQGEPS